VVYLPVVMKPAATATPTPASTPTLTPTPTATTLPSCVVRPALGGVMVDIWHCDALGVYSDMNDPGFNTAGQNFLRGFQLTDSNGIASFATIYPGWYSSRAVHIHFKLRTLSSSGSVTSEFTSQLFFNESITDSVHTTSPYNTKGFRDTLNSADNIYQNGGSQLLLSPNGNTASGYTATIDIGLNIA
jgi:protocatechuate 3,4-dioxygenase beta subunit